MRVLHRNLGFIALAMTIVYSLSGITLIYRTSDFMKSTQQVETTLKPNLTAEKLGDALKMKKLKVTDENDATIFFAEGQYDKQTGKAIYEKKELMFPFNKFANLHKAASAQQPVGTIFTTLFGIILFFLALSSLFMFKVSSKQFKEGMLYTLVGIIITIVIVALCG